MYLFSAAYGVSRTVVNRLSQDMSLELKPYNVCSLVLYPGPVKKQVIGLVVPGSYLMDRDCREIGMVPDDDIYPSR